MDIVWALTQANPGLTPSLIKAILQYSAQPVAGANLLQQGAGLLNVDGAVRLALSLRTDIRTSVEAGTLAPGASLLAAGQSLPLASSTVNGETFNWSRIVYAGGNQVMSGGALFTKFQPIWDQRLVWARGVARCATVTFWPATSGVPANTYAKSITWAAAPNQSLVTGGVVNATPLAGTSSSIGKTGTFIPTATLTGWLVAGSGVVMSESVVMNESGQSTVSSANDSSLLGEP
jgi:serine protease AprX